MDTLVWIAIGVLVLAALAATMYALNRSRGSFPRDARYQPRSGPSAPGASSLQPNAPTPADDAPEGLVPILNPLVRRSAAQALARGGTATRYIVQQGDELFFDFRQIDDPAKRRQAYEMMRGLNNGQDIDFRATVQLIGELFGK